MTREEHLAWAKERALAYLPFDVQEAGTSFISDLGKHEDLADHPVKDLIFTHMVSGLFTEKNARALITGTR